MKWKLAVALILPALFAFSAAALSEEAISSEGKGVKLTDTGEKVIVEIDGTMFTEYHYKDVPRPFFYPVIGPTGDAITRNYPMAEGKDEEKDHKHHRSLWYTHGEVGGVDFWSEDGAFGKIVHQKFTELTSGADKGVMKTEDNWVAADGKVVCSDTRIHTFYAKPEGRMMDIEIIYHASQGDLVLGDTKEGSMAMRLAPTMRVKGKVGKGHIINSEGVKDGDTWGKRAAWCDYYGPVNDKVVGVAIFDHPANPRYPTWWHVRDYGLFGANPFGISYFEDKPRGTGDMKIPSGESLTWKYRFWLHNGDEKEGKVAELFKEFSAAK